MKAIPSLGRPMGHQKVLAEVRAVAAGMPKASAEGRAIREAGDTGYPHVLISYFYDRDQSFFEKKLGYNPQTWMGDSGAFSAWTLGGEGIDLDDYISWCLYYRSLKPDFVCVSLDVIAGRRDAGPTNRENERAMAESLENGDKMRDAGLSIMEVYHQWEPLSHLETLLERRQPREVLGISPRDRRPPAERSAFCESVFSLLKSSCGWQQLVPTHGLGVSPVSPIGSRFPWWSVDASSWVASAVYGQEVLPSGKRRNHDSRNTDRDLRKLYLLRTLNAWLVREQALTKLWHDRGIRFVDAPNEIVLETS